MLLSKGGAVMRAQASHQCGLGSNPGVDGSGWFSSLLREVLLQVVRSGKHGHVSKNSLTPKCSVGKKFTIGGRRTTRVIGNTCNITQSGLHPITFWRAKTEKTNYRKMVQITAISFRGNRISVLFISALKISVAENVFCAVNLRWACKTNISTFELSDKRVTLTMITW